MSFVPLVFVNIHFQRVEEVDVEDNDSTLIDSESDDRECLSLEEMDEMKNEQKIPALIIEATHRPDDLEEINKALWQAAQQGKSEVCKEILSSSFYGKYSADINYKASKKWTPLHVSAFEGHLEVCQLLLSHKNSLEIDAKDEENLTALHLSCKQGHLKIAHSLVKNGADVNLSDNKGNSLLHIASASGHKKIVSWLLILKPDLYCLNSEGLTAEQVAGEGIKEIFVQYQEIREMMKGGGLRSKPRVSYPWNNERKSTRRMTLNAF
jgi:ankyrin repeat protein